MGKLGFVAIIIVVFAILIIGYLLWDTELNYWLKFQIIVVTLTLIAIIIYVYDTNKIAKNAQSQTEDLKSQTDAMKHQTLYIQRELDYIQGASLSICLNEIYDPKKEDWKEINSVILVKNTESFNVEAKLSVVLKYGDDIIVRHSDKYYSGKEIWHISVGQDGNGNFNLNDIFGAIGMKSTQFIEKLFSKDLKHKLEVAVFSRIRRYGKNEKYTDNITQFYYMGVAQRIELHTYRDGTGNIIYDPSKEKVKSVPKWVWEPKAPPNEMEEIAFDDEK